MPILVDRAVDTPDFDLPFESHLVELAIRHQVVVDLRKQCLCWNHDDCLRSPDLVLFVLFELLTNGWDIL